MEDEELSSAQGALILSGSGTPPSFDILSESGDQLLTEDNDTLRKE